jgi:type IV secretory pathway VirB4 component
MLLLVGLCAARGRESEAEAARRQLEALLRARGFIPQRLIYIAARALLHFQPGGELFPGLEEPTLLLEEVVPLLPAPGRTVFPASDAVWLGVHAQDGRDVFFSFTRGLDPSAPPPPHAFSLILGEMGAGKTSLLRLILLQRLLQGRTVVSLDPEGENNRLCQAIGGRVIPAGPPDDSETCLLHPLAGEDPAEMLLSARFLLSALSGEAALSPGAQAALHEAVRRRWERRPGPMALIDLLETLAALGTAEAAGPVALLRPYARSGLLSGFFDRPQALLSPNLPAGTWWNFDLSSLREESRALVHAALSWFFYHVVTVGKQPVDVFIDEGWRLLRSGPFADLLDELGRRARKRGVGVMLSTHLPADLARQAASLGLAATAFVGRLPQEEAFTFFRALGVPEGESRQRAEQAGRLPPHTFLAAPAGGRGALFPVQVILPTAWLEFWKALGAAR